MFKQGMAFAGERMPVAVQVTLQEMNGKTQAKNVPQKQQGRLK